MKQSFFQPFILAIIMALTIFSSCSVPSAGKETGAGDDPLGKLFIIGGGSRPSEMIQRMIDEAGLQQGGYVVILPMASEIPDTAIIRSARQFHELGVQEVHGLHFLAGEAADPHKLELLENASLVYISGGSQVRFMNVVANTAIEQAIRSAYQRGAVIAGSSAGAAIMSRKMITGDQLRHPQYRPTFALIEAENLDLADGLGLIETAIIDQHFVWRSRHNRLITAVLEYPELPGIGIDEATAILVSGNQAEVVGISQVLVYRNPKGSRKEQDHKLGGEGLRLDVYLPGDKFLIRQ